MICPHKYHTYCGVQETLDPTIKFVMSNCKDCQSSFFSHVIVNGIRIEWVPEIKKIIGYE